MTCLTWNLQWKSPAGATGKLIQGCIAALDPDVIGFTETVIQMVPEGYRIESDPDYGYKNEADQRKVILWSKSPFTEIDIVGDADMPTGRFVSGVSDGIRFIGVCIPWRDAHVRNGKKNRRQWEDHLAFCAGLASVLARSSSQSVPICLLGDFNQRIPIASQPIHVYDALARAIPSNMKIITEGIRDENGGQLIDHIAVSQSLTASTPQIVSRYSSDGTELSDHVGVWTCLQKTKMRTDRWT
ncbi:MAG: endonuclease/exonuclease/phosphatase family protein [Candidatus Methylacidiphilales bacterium]|nr:endonuclease/exonuclease/phosphatase family protein [Candidatus Methylacidiphilales bacterium]